MNKTDTIVSHNEVPSYEMTEFEIWTKERNLTLEKPTIKYCTVDQAGLPGPLSIFIHKLTYLFDFFEVDTPSYVKWSLQMYQSLIRSKYDDKK